MTFPQGDKPDGAPTPDYKAGKYFNFPLSNTPLGEGRSLIERLEVSRDGEASVDLDITGASHDFLEKAFGEDRHSPLGNVGPIGPTGPFGS